MPSQPLPIKLIVGLANPGAEYANTRHNAGAWFVEALANREHVTLSKHAKFHGLYATTTHFHLLIPTTYMNCSGRSVLAVANFFKLPPESILIAHDDIDLPVADVRLKFDGGAGGHNGLTDIFQVFNSKKFARLRIGVGRPTQSHEVVHYVLKPPSKPERHAIEDALQDTYPLVPLLVEGKFDQAIQRLHTKSL